MSGRSARPSNARTAPAAARFAHRRQPDLDVVEEVVPAPDVDAPAAGEPVAAQVEGVDVQARLGHEAAGPLIPAAVLADAVDDQDSRPGLADAGHSRTWSGVPSAAGHLDLGGADSGRGSVAGLRRARMLLLPTGHVPRNS
jgi:hypothetical protein